MSEYDAPFSMVLCTQTCLLFCILL